MLHWQEETLSQNLLPSVPHSAVTILFADIEDGHTLHLVERPAGVPPSAPPGQAHPHHQHQGLQGHRINIGMIDVNGAIAASGVSLNGTGTRKWLSAQILPSSWEVKRDSQRNSCGL